MSSSNVNTTRRRLDFGRKRNAPLSNNVAIPRSLSSSLSDSQDILSPLAVKQVVDFYASATPPGEYKSAVQQQEDADEDAVRNMVHEGHQHEKAREYAAIIRDMLGSKIEKQLAAEEWMFSGVPIEKEV